MPDSISAFPLLSRRDAAAYLGITPESLETAAMRRSGPVFFRFATGFVRYRREDLDAWLATVIVTPQAA